MLGLGGDSEGPRSVPSLAVGSAGLCEPAESSGLIIPSINDKPRSFPGLHDKFMVLFNVLAARPSQESWGNPGLFLRPEVLALILTGHVPLPKGPKSHGGF